MEHQNIRDLAKLHPDNPAVMDALEKVETIEQDESNLAKHHKTRVGLTVNIVSAYVSNNATTKDQFIALIEGVDSTLETLAKNEPVPEPEALPEPAVPILESVQPEYIVCLEDGLHFKSMKRHLRAKYNMTPEAYRQRWGLPANYPMVAPKYSERRRELATNR